MCLIRVQGVCVYQKAALATTKKIEGHEIPAVHGTDRSSQPSPAPWYFAKTVSYRISNMSFTADDASRSMTQFQEQ
jgi:hypothetical protein